MGTFARPSGVSIPYRVFQVLFSIADTGSGIPKQDLPHIFDPFYRAEGSRNPETGGTGRGLTIARRILRVHGGELIAPNRVSGGADFTGWVSLDHSIE